jgi:hypothetical protein
MFDFDCPACERRQLLFPSQVTGIVNDDHGIEVLVTCWCGTPGAIRTGRAAAAERHALAS